MFCLAKWQVSWLLPEQRVFPKAHFSDVANAVAARNEANTVAGTAPAFPPTSLSTFTHST